MLFQNSWSTRAVVTLLGTSVLAVSGFACLYVFSGSFSIAKGRDASPISHQHADEEPTRSACNVLRRQFAVLDEIAFEGEVRIVAHRDIDGALPVGEELIGQIAYSARGADWRMRSVVPGYLGMNTDIVYEGRVLQYMQRDKGTLGVSVAADDRARGAGLAIINPILALSAPFAPDRIDRLNPTLAECAEYAIDMAPNWLSWEAVDGGAALHGVVRRDILGLDGQTLGHLDSAVTFPDDLGGMPSRIEHLSPAGEVVARIDFTDYRAFPHHTGNMFWPAIVTLAAFEPGANEPAVEITITLTDLRIGEGAVGNSAFTLDWDEASRIWVEEIGRFLR